MRYLIVIMLFTPMPNLFAQISGDTVKTNEILLVADNAPEYPGGREELYKFIGSKLKYPKDARKSGVEGTVVISFVIERDGTVNTESIKVEQSVHPSIDNEAIRVVKLMPKWTPASHSGRTVRSKTGFPIIFGLK